MKYQITYADMINLRQKLSLVAYRDIHASDGCYDIRSLYFDNLYDKALIEKLDGVNKREKYRIRYYNGNTSFIKLEKKSKFNGLCCKQCEIITAEKVKALLNGDIGWMINSESSLLCELYQKINNEVLRPKTIVDYKREAYTYPAGNVRITIDYEIKTGIYCRDFLNPDCVMLPVAGNTIILEVKWDEFLPDIIKNVIQLGNRRLGAFSKYAACRIYG